MILRLWKGRARIDSADAYQQHVTTTVFPKLQALPEYVRGRVLRRTVDGQVEFLVMTEWVSLDAVRTFAGDALDRAVVDPAARAVLTTFDDHVEHFEIVADDLARTGKAS
jgi:heme-degrading monooxygenase HmoA